jgi:hypothetical protein
MERGSVKVLTQFLIYFVQSCFQECTSGETGIRTQIFQLVVENRRQVVPFQVNLKESIFNALPLSYLPR